MCAQLTRDLFAIAKFLFSPSGIDTPSFSVPNGVAIVRRVPPNGDVDARGYEKSRFSTNISLYLGNDARNRKGDISNDLE